MAGVVAALLRAERLDDPPGRDVGAVALRGALDVLLTARPDAALARRSVAMPKGKAGRWRSSARVASGLAAMAARIASACDAQVVARRGAARGAVPPVAWRRCSSRRAQAGLARYLAATAAVPIPSSRSARTRSRGPIE